MKESFPASPEAGGELKSDPTGKTGMVLVTGASGFLGQHLVRRLSAEGKSVRALYHRSKPGNELLTLPGIHWEPCDLLDIYDVDRVLEGISDVYHCAAIISFDPAHRRQVLHTNVESTVNLVNGALEQGIRKLVHVSSVSSLGRTASADKVITEETEWEESSRNSAYGISKFLSEMEVWRGMGEGLNAVILNPGIILGAPASAGTTGGWQGSAHLMEVAFKEFPFYTEGITSWVDVQDVVQIMTGLMESDISSERYIVSAGNFSFKEVFTGMAQALGKKPPHIRATSFMTGLVWRWSLLRSVLNHKPPFITRETARNARTKSLYSNEKLLTALPGYQYIPMEETIRGMAAAFLTNNQRVL